MNRRQGHTRKFWQQIALLKLLLRRVGVQLVLAGWVIPDLARKKISRLRSDFPVMRTVLTIVVCTAVIVPWTMYRTERTRRVEINDEFNRLSVETGAEIHTLGVSLQTLLNEQDELRSLLLDAGYPVVSGDRLWIRLLATGYSSRVCETDDTPFITASNTRTRPGVVALSRDMLRRYNGQAPFTFGDAIHISGIGDFIVEDSMNRRWRQRLDIWFPSREAAANFGIRRVTVTMPLLPAIYTPTSNYSNFPDYSAATSYVSNSALPQ